MRLRFPGHRQGGVDRIDALKESGPRATRYGDEVVYLGCRRRGHHVERDAGGEVEVEMLFPNFSKGSEDLEGSPRLIHHRAGRDDIRRVQKMKDETRLRHRASNGVIALSTVGTEVRGGVHLRRPGLRGEFLQHRGRFARANNQTVIEIAI